MELVISVVVILMVALPFLSTIVFLKVEKRLRTPKVAEPLAGTVVVTGMSKQTQSDFLPNLGDLVPAHEDFWLDGVAHVPGMQPYSVRLRDAAWTTRWPRVGQTIPVDVDQRDPSRVRIRWDDLR